jgi:hypothetical protein
MRLSWISLILLLLIAVAAPPSLTAQEVLPRFSSVDPMNGKVGTDITITGENIGAINVAKVYFTDGKNDFEVKVSEQTDTTIKTKIPAGVKPGIRYKLMLLTKGKEPKLIEQPVRVEIDEE